jgi:dTDP-4-dehydrorhamnose reductase
MRIVVTGAKGQLGTDLVAEIQSKHPEDTVLGIDRAECDITDKDAVMKVIKELKPDAVIHLAAYTAVDKAEADPSTCDLINVQGTNYLVEAAKAVGAKFLYISTDYVFDGEKEGAYEIEDIKNPLSIYGQTKSEAEDVVEAYSKHFIVRISWAFGSPWLEFPSYDAETRGNPQSDSGGERPSRFAHLHRGYFRADRFDHPYREIRDLSGDE